MAIKRFKPTSNASRNRTVLDFSDITTSSPEKTLIKGKSKRAGRNHQRRITTRHQGGGHKRKYRVIGLKRKKDGIPGHVATIEYDPNRTANIALIIHADGEKRYILGTNGLETGDIIESEL